MLINYLQKTHFKFKNINRLKVKGQEKVYHANSNHKKTEMAMLISDIIDFKTKKMLLEINRDIL